MDSAFAVGLPDYIATDIDAVINRYTTAAPTGEIRNPDSFIRSCLFSAGKAEGLAKLAAKSYIFIDPSLIKVYMR